jgi:hypothetical protein
MTLHLPRVGRYSRRSCQWRKQRDRCDTISLARTTLSGRFRGCNGTKLGHRQYKLLATQVLPLRYPFVEEITLTSASVAIYEWRCRLFRCWARVGSCWMPFHTANKRTDTSTLEIQLWRCLFVLDVCFIT